MTPSFSFDGWQVQPDRNRLLKPNGDPSDLPSQAMRVLVVLAHSGGSVLSRGELLDRVWQGRAVTDDVLTVAIHTLRKALGDRAEAPRYIETIKGRGYRFCASIAPIPGPPSDALPTSSELAENSETNPSPLRRSSRRFPRLWQSRSTALPLTVVLLALAMVSRPLWSPSSQPPPPPTVAVLPIQPFAPTAAEISFADALNAGLTDALAATGKVEVVATTAMRRYRDSTLDTATIAHQLQATAVLEVTVVRRLDVLQVSVSLIDAQTERRTFTERYAESINDVPGLERRIAEAVAARLVQGPAPYPPISDTASWVPQEARDSWVEAELSMKEATPEAMDRARDALLRAIALAPGFAPAHTALANLYLRQLGEASIEERPPLLAKAQQAVEEALALDPGFAPAWTTRACLRMYFEWDLEGAEADFHRAFTLSSESSAPHTVFHHLLSAQGRHRAAEAHARAAARLDPFNAHRNLELASVLALGDRLQEALQVVDSIPEPSLPQVLRLRAGLLDLLGREEEALEAYLLFLRASEPAFDETRWRAIAQTEGLAGFHSAWLQHPSLAPTGLLRAAIEVRAGRTEQALNSLDRLLENRDPMLLTLAHEPAFLPLRQDSRFLSIVSATGKRSATKPLNKPL